ncbi:MAG: hypothetical protein GYA24_25540 [Candidatus Lokiarchaeota archaeon]|nr:hypothetical protein [Candidatus Lokiarchaeota archaeon]
MARSLVAFVKANNMLPFACTFVKTFKDGAAQVDYAPTQWEKFAIKVEPALAGASDLATFFQHDAVPANPAIPGSRPATPVARQASAKPAGKGSKVTLEPAIEAAAAITDGSVSIFNAEITAIEQHESKYQDEVTIFYLATLKGGTVAIDAKKSTERKPFTTIRARFSEAIMAETSPAAGDHVTFNGKLKDDKFFGLVLQNVKKVTK